MRVCMKKISQLTLILSVLAFTLFSESSYAESRTPIPAAVYMPQAGKRVACFITINSTEEKDVFTKYLDPKEWDLVELTAPTSNGGKDGWFGNACKRDIQCDINVVSGHFAGTFFGSSGYSLALSELENHSCAQDCKGILEHPKEVYLFGCNALASKEGDHRTPEQYYAVLREDGYPHETATRVVEDRYGALGQDNRGKVQRAFIGVPYIHGFYSTSPLGRDLKPRLERYMKSLGNFTEYFDSISERGVTAKTEPNTALNTALKGLSFTQCSGLDSKDPEYLSHLQICMLFDRTVPITDRLLSVELMLNSEKVLALLPSVHHFMRANIDEIKQSAGGIFERLHNNKNAKKILIETLATLKSPIIKIEWMRFAYLMDWISREDLTDTIFELVTAAFSSSSFEPDMGNAVCSLSGFDLQKMDFSSIISKIEPFHFTSHEAAKAMGCIGLTRYSAFRETLNTIYREKTQLSSTDTRILATLFADSAATLEPTAADHELLARLNSLCVTYPLSSSDLSCGRALAKLGARDRDGLVAPTLVAILKAASPSLQLAYATDFQIVDGGQDLIESAMLEVYLRPNHPYWFGLEAYFFARPLRLVENQKRLYQYLLGSTPDRRPDEMIYALREMRMTPTQVEATLKALHEKGNPLVTSRVFSGYLHLANGAGAATPLIEKLFKEHAHVIVTNENDLKAFYEALALPKIKAAIRNSPTAKQSLCSIRSTSSLLKTERFNQVNICP